MTPTRAFHAEFLTGAMSMVEARPSTRGPWPDLFWQIQSQFMSLIDVSTVMCPGHMKHLGEDSELYCLQKDKAARLSEHLALQCGGLHLSRACSMCGVFCSRQNDQECSRSLMRQDPCLCFFSSIDQPLLEDSRMLALSQIKLRCSMTSCNPTYRTSASTPLQNQSCQCMIMHV